MYNTWISWWLSFCKYCVGVGTLTRWDEREKTKDSSISNALLMIIGIFALGFVVGAIWGYMFADSVVSTPVPPAFGESIQNFKIILYDGIGISDTVILSSDTFIKP